MAIHPPHLELYKATGLTVAELGNFDWRRPPTFLVTAMMFLATRQSKPPQLKRGVSYDDFRGTINSNTYVAQLAEGEAPKGRAT